MKLPLTETCDCARQLFRKRKKKEISEINLQILQYSSVIVPIIVKSRLRCVLELHL